MEIITKEKIREVISTGQPVLYAVQPKLCAPMVNRIYRKLMIGVPFPGIKVIDGMIGDGHHRYIASLLAKVALEHTPTNSTSAMEKIDWVKVVVEEDEWESAADIDKHNQQDAEVLQIEVHQLIERMEK